MKNVNLWGCKLQDVSAPRCCFLVSPRLLTSGVPCRSLSSNRCRMWRLYPSRSIPSTVSTNSRSVRALRSFIYVKTTSGSLARVNEPNVLQIYNQSCCFAVASLSSLEHLRVLWLCDNPCVENSLYRKVW